MVNLSAIPRYLERRIIPELPSAGPSLTCNDEALRVGLRTCSWEGIEPRSVPGPPTEWLNVRAESELPGSGVVKFSGVDTRSCSIHFDYPVNHIHVANSSAEFQTLYPPPSDLQDLHLWSREWDKEFAVSFDWEGETHISGRVACEWADKTSGRIPALDEVTNFLPIWSTVTKMSSGLVVVSKRFSI